jgi:hypothetical protein
MSDTVQNIMLEALEGAGMDAPPGITNALDSSRQAKALLNWTARDIIMRGGSFGWEELRSEGTFTTTAVELQTNVRTDYPDYYKIIDNTMWNHTQQRRIFGPVSVQTWRRYQADTVAPATLTYYMRGNEILFAGTPQDGETVYYEYVSKHPFQATGGGATKELLTAEDDEVLLDRYMFVLGLRWRYLQAKGFEYGETFRQYEDYVAERLATNTPKETYSVNPNWRRDGWEDQQIPEGSWNI